MSIKGSLLILVATFLGWGLVFCDEPDGGGLPCGRLERDTPLGRIIVSLDKFQESEKEKTASADVSVGCVIVHEVKDFLPYLLAFEPFVVNRVESNPNGVEIGQSSGVGLGVSNKAENGEPVWYFRTTLVSSENRVNTDESSMDVEIKVGVEIPFGVTRHRSDLKSRLDPDDRRVYISLPRMWLDEQLKLSVEDIRSIHVILMASYFKSVRGAPDNDNYQPVFSWLEFIQETIKRRPSFHEQDVLSGKVESSAAERKEILKKYVEPWLLEKMRNENPLVVRILSEDKMRTQDLVQIKPRVLKEAAPPYLLNPDQMLDDFISTSAEAI